MSRQSRPRARTVDLSVHSVDQETLVYDKTTDKAYVLNPTASAVWRACNGERTVPELAVYLSQQSPTSEQTVWYSLGQLKDLLEEPVTVPQEFAGISRRKFLFITGAVAAGVAVPVVVMLSAPAPAQAQSGALLTCNCLFSDCISVSNCDTECATYCSGSIACCGESCGCT